jgi:tetratricopeptide (TPR) repeat protein
MGEKLLYVFYQDSLDAVTIHEYIGSIDRLDELVAVQQSDIILPAISNALYVHENRIHILPDWLDKRPAIIFPSEIPFNKNYFLGTIFGMLGNADKYPQYFTGYPAMLYTFDLIHCIINGEEADSALENVLGRTKFAHPFENYTFNHNVAIALNYARFSNPINAEAIEAHYTDALELAFEPSYKALTVKYYAIFLIDNGESKAAMQLLQEQHFKTLDDYPGNALERVWCQAAMMQLRIPYDPDFIGTLKTRLWETLQFFDQRGHKTIAAFLWMDAATIANMSNSHAESLGYIQKAIAYFKEEGQVEMLAQAQQARGRICYDWAQSGNPQFYRSALEAYQDALTVFKKEDAPEVFAEIHHQLGIIYAELPDENKKRSIWAALSATSFHAALEYYNKVDHPYEFGMICNNFANAYTKYPQAGRSDNFEKALDYYEEALSVRPALEYPTERAITLLNYLEASWKAGNPGEEFNVERYHDMIAKVNEIRTLTDDQQLIAETDKHIHMLEMLEREMSTDEKH